MAAHGTKTVFMLAFNFTAAFVSDRFASTPLENYSTGNVWQYCVRAHLHTLFVRQSLGSNSWETFEYVRHWRYKCLKLFLAFISNKDAHW